MQGKELTHKDILKLEEDTKVIVTSNCLILKQNRFNSYTFVDKQNRVCFNDNSVKNNEIIVFEYIEDNKENKIDLEYCNIIDSIQFTVDKIVKNKYAFDEDTPPTFIVSQLDIFNEGGKIITHEIALTIQHMGFVRTRSIFPRPEYKYGYESLQNEIEWLYNSTM